MLEALTTTSNGDAQHPEKELTPQQFEAALLLAQGETNAHTAATLGISTRTIDRWKHIPEFQAALKQARAEIYQSALDLVQASMPAAVRTLVRNLDSKASYIQVQAATELLKLGIDVHSLHELESKVDELESRLADRKKDSRLWAI